jgi:ribonucleoside-diphosphate reductase alpha subunit
MERNNKISMFVTKRNGDKEEVSFDKVLNRIKSIKNKPPELKNVNASFLAQKVCSRIYDNVKTSELDELASQISASMIIEEPEYGEMASRIIVSNHHKNTSPSFSETIYLLYNNRTYGKHTPLIDKDLYEIVMNNKNKLNDVINYERDFSFDYFGFKTLERAYLMKVNNRVIERPQHMLMRVSLGIHGEDFKDALSTYECMSKQLFIHATPTLFNSGTPRPQLSSCFLLSMKNDSIDGIFSTLKDCANISKWAGGIGLHIHNIRSKSSHIRGTNGTSNGIVPMLRCFNETARYVDQGGGKRNGSFAIYLEPWHSDIEDFIDLRKNHGDENMRARDLFLGLWVPDLFMERVRNNSDWTLMCPDKCPGLSDCYGKDFEELYVKYEKEGRGNKTIKAQELWFKIITSQIETGTPYILYKDACNSKSNQKNLGCIKSSNLCTEIIEYTNSNETAVCNLASINLTSMVKRQQFEENIKIYSKSDCKYCKYAKNYLNNRDIEFEEILLDDKKEREDFFAKINQENGEEDSNISTVPQIFINEKRIGGFQELYLYNNSYIDYKELYNVTRIITKNLNKIIDRNFYPIPETEKSNKKHRPIGIGVQGLADVFCKMKVPFDSKEAREINDKIFETIYFASLEESMEISKKREPHLIRYKGLSLQDNLSEEEKNELVDIRNKYKPINEEIERDNYLGSYSSFIGSPSHEGILQYDLWGHKPSERYDWNDLKSNIQKYGLRNSLLLAPMPTASTSQIMGNNECFEPYTSNIYLRRTLAGEFIKVNNYMLDDLISIGIWDSELKNKILINNGQINGISDIPSCIQNIYKTAWEISQKSIIDMAADRGKWICQSQSMNLFLEDPDFSKITSMHFYSWQKGLKTGMYYLRTQSKVKAQQFTIDPSKQEECLSCGS